MNECVNIYKLLFFLFLINIKMIAIQASSKCKNKIDDLEEFCIFF
jgi:hypothetical protein